MNTANPATPMPTALPESRWLRIRDGRHARVTYEELAFDLVTAFSVTQVSHQLLEHLTARGVAEALIVWFAVWLGWQYGCWFTNWFEPRLPRVRVILFGTMLTMLAVAAAIPESFGARGLVFASAYATMQVGRAACIVALLPGGHPLRANYLRILGWMCIAACFWIAGALAGEHERILLWAAAIACEYFSPMFGFAFPGLGRSRTSDWTIEGGHLAERCQALVIVALGETLVATGATLTATAAWTGAVLSALMATFLGSAVYKHVVCARVPRSHLLGALALVALVPIGFGTSLLAMGWLTTAVLLAVGLWDTRAARD